LTNYDERIDPVISRKLRSGAVQAICSLAIVMTLISTASVATADVGHASRRHHHSTHHTRGRHMGIPQHNGGDHDSDNNGGPSDGDGNQ
jgi:hypothetical protein